MRNVYSAINLPAWRPFRHIQQNLHQAGNSIDKLWTGTFRRADVRRAHCGGGADKLVADFTQNTERYVFQGIAKFVQMPPIIVTGARRGVRGLLQTAPSRDCSRADHRAWWCRSRWPAAFCTSSSWAPFSSAVVMKVARIDCASSRDPSLRPGHLARGAAASKGARPGRGLAQLLSA